MMPSDNEFNILYQLRVSFVTELTFSTVIVVVSNGNKVEV